MAGRGDKNNKSQDEEEIMTAQILEIGKPISLIIGKNYACNDDKVRITNHFWVEAAENGLVKGINKRWVIHYKNSSDGFMKMNVLNGVPFSLEESEFVITDEVVDAQKTLYYLERTA